MFTIFLSSRAFSADLVREKELAAELQRLEIEEQKNRIFPEFKLSVGYGESDELHEEDERGLLSFVSMDWNLFRGGGDYFLLKKSKARLNAIESERQLEIKRLQFEKYKLQQELTLFSELMEIEKAEIESYQKQMIAAQRRVQSGITTSADLLEIELARYEAETHIQTLQVHIENKKRELEQYQDVPDFVFAEVVPNSFDQTMSGSIIKSKLEAAEHEARSAKANIWPSLDLSASYGQLTPQSQNPYKLDEYHLGVLLTWKFGGSQSQILKSQVQTKQAHLNRVELANAQKQKSITFENLKNELKETERLLKIQKEILNRAEKLEKATANEYRLGVKNGSDWLEISQKFVTKQKELKELELTYKLQKAELQTF
ncbi:MAG: TolC family protein [Bdellovibrionia bacterium]